MFLIEVLATFAYVTTVLSVVYSNAENKMPGGIIIVFVLFATICTAGTISGGSINPAVGIAQQVFQNIMVAEYPNTFNGGSNRMVRAGLNSIWVYSLGPWVGGFLAGLWKQYDANTQLSIDKIEFVHPKALQRAATMKAEFVRAATMKAEEDKKKRKQVKADDQDSFEDEMEMTDRP